MGAGCRADHSGGQLLTPAPCTPTFEFTCSPLRSQVPIAPRPTKLTTRLPRHPFSVISNSNRVALQTEGLSLADSPHLSSNRTHPGERLWRPFRPNANGGPGRISVLAGGRSGRAKLLLSRIPVAPQEYLQQRAAQSSVQRLGRSLALPSLCRRHSQAGRTRGSDLANLSGTLGQST